MEKREAQERAIKENADVKHDQAREHDDKEGRVKKKKCPTCGREYEGGGIKETAYTKHEEARGHMDRE